MCAKAKEPENRTKKERGPYNSSLQSLLDIWNVLAAHAAPDRPLTAGQIAKYLDADSGKTRKKAPKPKEGETPNPQYAEDSLQKTHASAQTVDRILPHAADIINTVFPHTVLREEGNPAILHTYGHQQTLHVVLETPNGEPLWKGPMAAVLTQTPLNPIPYSTLTRMLPQLMQEYDGKKPVDEEETAPEHPPISLAGVVAAGKTGGKPRYIPASQWEGAAKAANSKQSPTRKFFLESILSPAQWRILSDLILVYPYISERETSKFLSAMKRLAPGVRNWSGQRYAQKTTDAVNFEHIQQLDDAIRSQVRVSLIYGKYQLVFGTDRRWRPQLMPMSSNEGRMLVEPYAMMWSNGYYYLVCKDGDIMRNLRVDRILKVLPTTISFEKDKEFDPYAYRDRSPVMYPGEPIRIRLRCQLSLLSTLMDFFGTTIADYTAPTPEGYTTVTLTASEMGTRLFALQYADRVEVLEPKSLRAEIKKTLQEAVKRY